MTIPLLVLGYAYSVVLVTTYILTDLPLAYRLAMRCKSRRVTLVAVVAGVLWPVLLACFLAGLVWYATMQPRDYYGSGHW